jgi:protocatechuate 4,5-dioxygenase alpha chain
LGYFLRAKSALTVGKEQSMTQKTEAYEDIPGTWVFDAQRARKGYRLNEFLYSLMKADNRKEFLADERTYTTKFAMTEDQREAILKRDWNKMLELGAVSYALAKLAFTDGKSYQFMASQMTGMTEKEYVEMMVSGGRSPDGWRSKSERKGKP